MKRSGRPQTHAVHQGLVIQESNGVRLALTGASYFVPHQGPTPVGKSLDDIEWSPRGTEVHAAIAEPAVANYVAGEPFAEGYELCKFEYSVGARTPAFTEVFARGGFTGTLVIGKKALTLRKSRLPYVLTEDAVAKAWMPPAGESALPRTLELDIPPELRFWLPGEGVSGQAVRDYLVKSAYMTEDNVQYVDGELRRLQLEYSLPAPFAAVDGPCAVAPPDFEPEAPAATFAEVEKAFDPDDAPCKSVRLLKADDSDENEERYVLGIVLEPETTDSQNEIYSADVIRKSSFEFMANYRKVGLQHAVIVKSEHVRIVESYIAPVDMTLGEGDDAVEVKKGTWLMGLHIVNDELWEAVKDGTFTGLSIGGYGVLVPDVTDETAKDTE